MSHIILRLPDVIKQTGLSRSSIYLRIANHKFPQPISFRWLATAIY
jgi:prophage regulatory protein